MKNRTVLLYMTFVFSVELQHHFVFSDGLP